MKTILIFEPGMGGHRAGFIRCLSNYWNEHPVSGIRLVFITAPEYVDLSLENCTFDPMTDAEAQRMAHAGRYQKPWILFSLLKKACRRHAPDHVLVLELTHLELPFALAGAPRPLSAILFVQYPELSRGVKFFYKHLKTKLLLFRAPVKNVFLLNGQQSCEWLARRFGTRARFVPVPDPIFCANSSSVDFSQTGCGSNSKQVLFLFFGALSVRKGASFLLNSLSFLSTAAAQKSVFLFCGQPEPGYEMEFRERCNALCSIRPDIDLRTDCRFVSDMEMRAVFEQSDVVLLPYLRSEYSSGILGAAACAGRPVIGPESGLIGRLITQNGLGTTCEMSLQAWADAIADAVESRPPINKTLCTAFVQQSSPQNFARRIVDTICHDD